VSKKNKPQPTLRKQLEKRLAKRQKQGYQPHWPGRSSQPAGGVVAEARRLMAEGAWEEARDLLTERDAKTPGRLEILNPLLEVYHELHEYESYVRLAKRLIELAPENPGFHIALAGGYMKLAHPVLALNEFTRYLRRWPHDVMAPYVRETIAELQERVEEFLSDLPFPPDQRLELAALHEEVQSALHQGEFARTIELAQRLIRRVPDFLPAINNMSQAYFQLGQTEQAIACCRQVLERDSDNYHALGNLAKFLFLSGRVTEAQEPAERLKTLKALKSGQDDLWVRQAEVFCVLGDDAAVLAALRGASESGAMDYPVYSVALLHHFAAVAYARQGKESAARRHWREAVEIAPQLDLASRNLKELDKPVGERDAPWAIDSPSLLPKTVCRELAAACRQEDAGEGKPGSTKVRRFLAAHPELLHLAAMLLDRGDPLGRDFALWICKSLATREAHQVLLDFCQSPRGPDAERSSVATYLKEQGCLPEGTLTMWMRGESRELKLMGMEISGEFTSDPLPPQIEEWHIQATEALHRQDGVTAERLLKQCIAVHGETPALLNNLAVAFQLQKREEEAFRLVREIHARWPDYFFGQTAMASEEIMAGKLEGAEQRLAALQRRQKLHTTEFDSLAQTYIQLSVAKHDFASARSWLEMWEQVHPDHPAIAGLKKQSLKWTLAEGLKGLIDSIDSRRRRRRK